MWGKGQPFQFVAKQPIQRCIELHYTSIPLEKFLPVKRNRNITSLNLLIKLPHNICNLKTSVISVNVVSSRFALSSVSTCKSYLFIENWSNVATKEL